MSGRKSPEPVEIKSDITLRQLLEAEASQERLSRRPLQISTRHIRVADQVFQWRQSEWNVAEDQRHTLELTRVLMDRGEPLDPILVTVVGDNIFVVDGHHRLQAYHTARWEHRVPVEYFEGTVQEAREEALHRNIKNKLPMTTEDKFEAAWRLVKDETHRTQTVIEDLTTVSRRTISTMASIWREHGNKLYDVPWRRAKRHQWQTDEDDLDVDDWKEKKAQEMAKTLLHNLGPDARKHVDILAMAFMVLDPGLASELASELSRLVEYDADETLDL